MNVETNGISLNVADKGQGDLAVVLMHCWGASSREWDKVIAALPAGYRTVAIDQRGWGSSDQPETGYDGATLADDVQGVIDALKLQRYVLVGHSMGGRTAQVLASRRPKGLAGVVLVAPSPPTPMHLPPEAVAGMGGSDIRPFVSTALVQMLTHTPLDAEDTEQMLSDAARASTAARTAWGRQTSVEDITDLVGRIDVPTVVIAGAQDKVDPVEVLSKEILPRIPGSVLKVIEDVGHLSPMEKPREVAQHIDAFAKALPSRG